MSWQPFLWLIFFSISTHLRKFSKTLARICQIWNLVSNIKNGVRSKSWVILKFFHFDQRVEIMKFCIILSWRFRKVGMVGRCGYEKHESHVSQSGDCHLWETSSQIFPLFKILMVENFSITKKMIQQISTFFFQVTAPLESIFDVLLAADKYRILHIVDCTGFKIKKIIVQLSEVP